MTLQGYDVLSDRIRLHVRATEVAVLIVEGPDDELVLKPHLEGVQFFPAAGRENALRTARDLLKVGVTRFLCVTDLDFDDPREFADLGNHHLVYEGTDLESMLVSLGVLALVLEHTGSSAKIGALGGADAVVAILIGLIGPISRLRACNREFAWGIAFDRVEIDRYIENKSGLTFRTREYILALLRNSAAGVAEAGGDAGELPSLEVLTALSQGDGPAPFRGKDVIVAAGVALRRTVGTLPKAACDEGVLCGQVRSSSGLALSRSGWLKNLRRRISVHSSVQS